MQIMSKFPDFVIIGAMKCGTTVLWRNLDKHPEITMGKNWEDPKKTSTEIRFWNNGGPHHTWKKKGIGWYKSLFSGGCCGEKSANYIESKAAFQRMHQHAPATKLILCVRNPVERAYSEYNMQRHTAPRKHTQGFNKAVNDAGYRKRGKYYEMLADNVLPFFPKNQIYIVIQERMYRDTVSEVNGLCDFLGVGHIEMDVQDISFKDRDGQTDSFRRWKTGYTEMSQKSRRVLVDYYVEPNRKLFDFLGHEIEEWK